MKDGSQATQEDGTQCNGVLIKTGPMVDKPIYFDLKKKAQLRKAYLEAEGTNSFFFEGQEILTAYAGYLLEHLDTRIKA